MRGKWNVFDTIMLVLVLTIVLGWFHFWFMPAVSDVQNANKTVKIMVPVLTPDLNVGYGFGTGIKISSDTFMTNAHVTGLSQASMGTLDGKSDRPLVFIRNFNGKEYFPAFQFAVNKENDIALVRSPLNTHMPLAIISDRMPDDGEELTVVGNSSDGDFVIVKAKKIGTDAKNFPPAMEIVLDSSGQHLIKSGFSGAGVFDKRGDVVGMIRACRTVQPGICIAISGRKLKQFKEKNQ